MVGQIVFYTLSDVDGIALGGLRQQVPAAVVTDEAADGTLSLHIFIPNPARPVLVRHGIKRGDVDQKGAWNEVAA
jgi:hypothetical protein